MRTTASGEITASHVSSASDCGAVCSGSHPPLAVVVVVLDQILPELFVVFAFA